jgi:hypothetical protein
MLKEWGSTYKNIKIQYSKVIPQLMKQLWKIKIREVLHQKLKQALSSIGKT